MKIQMELLSDTIFGNGVSVPGAEDISVQCDSNGFPYYKGGTFKGILREEYENYLYVCGKSESETASELKAIFGESGEDTFSAHKITVSDFVLSDKVRKAVMDEVGNADPIRISEIFTHTRTFTAIGDNGIVSDGSLRQARCIDKGLFFYGTIECAKEDETTIKEALSFVKAIGSMRNRGFGKVKLSVVAEG